MANRPAAALTLRDGDREVLESWTRSGSVQASAAKRARMMLLAADGVANRRIAELVDASRRRSSRGVSATSIVPAPAGVGGSTAMRSSSPRSLRRRKALA
jgi:MinD superfamily P-loop ATPase